MNKLKSLKILILIGLFCVAGNSSCSFQSPKEEPNLPELAFTDDLQEAIEMVLSAYPDYPIGISAAVHIPGYKTWTGVDGYSYQDVQLIEDMLFNVGSIQKNFEAALILRLAEDGKLSLDEPISNYLPPYKNVDGDITIRQLLNHTSGVFNVFEHPDFPWVGPDVDYERYWRAEEVFETFVLDPYGPPGYAQHYSSTNYRLLTLIAEEITGSTVPDEIDRHFLTPMKLTNTFTSMGELPPEQYKVAHPWADVDLDGSLDDLYGIPQIWIASLSHPVMYSTPSDLVNWTNALYYEESVLIPNSLEEMLTYPETNLRDPEGGVYGLGVVDYTYVNGTRAYGHMGSSLGFSGAALYLPEYEISVSWLINTGESPTWLAGYLMFDTWSALSKVIKAYADRFPQWE